MQTLRKLEELASPIPDEMPAASPAPVRPIDDHAVGGYSPARSLQQRLAVEWAARTAPTEAPRWAPRTTLLVAGGASLLLWGAIAAFVTAIL